MTSQLPRHRSGHQADSCPPQRSVVHSPWHTVAALAEPRQIQNDAGGTLVRLAGYTDASGMGRPYTGTLATPAFGVASVPDAGKAGRDDPRTVEPDHCTILAIPHTRFPPLSKRRLATANVCP